MKHTPGPWRAERLRELDVQGKPVKSATTFTAHVMTEPLDRYGNKIIGETSQRSTKADGEDQGNIDLVALAPTAPHECDDSKCPGNINRRKLETFDELVEALIRCGNVLIDVLPSHHPDFEVVRQARAAIAKVG